ncbi:hypothetical protein [Bacillus toyonensis]|uniref:hypothetical protein n=1 Tax=Bacillus toyonensis TaxID=155322 RepID=UPI002E1C65EA|nr:hypothetical protein [Bacillus toyonensis]
MKNKHDINPYEMVLDIAEIAKKDEWKDKENIHEEEQSIKKIINRPIDIKNYPYEAYKKFTKETDDNLS